MMKYIRYKSHDFSPPQEIYEENKNTCGTTYPLIFQ